MPFTDDAKTPPFGTPIPEEEEILDATEMLEEDGQGEPTSTNALESIGAVPTPRPEEDDGPAVERQITLTPVSDLLGSTPNVVVRDRGIKTSLPGSDDELDFSDLMEIANEPDRPLGQAPRSEPRRDAPRKEFSGPTVIEFEADYDDDDDLPAAAPEPAPPVVLGGVPEASDFQDIPTRNVNLQGLAEKLRDEEWDDSAHDAIELDLPPPPEVPSRERSEAVPRREPPSVPRRESPSARTEGPITTEIAGDVIVQLHLSRASELFDKGDLDAAADAAEQAIASDFDGSALRGKDREKQMLTSIFEAQLGAPSRHPRIVMDERKVADLGLDHRSRTMLGIIDGTASIEDLVDVAGFGKLDGYRALSTLVRHGVIRIG